MAYTIEIKKQITGEVRIARFDETWGDGYVFMWTQGNNACDCNRHEYFENRGYRKYDTDAPSDDHFPCGETEYRVFKAILEDGTEIVLDDPA